MSTLFLNGNVALSPVERQYVIALHALPGMSRRQLVRIDTQRQRQHLSWQEVWKSSASQWEDLGGSAAGWAAKRNVARQQTPAQLSELLATQHVAVVLCTDQAYPMLLKETADFPLALYCLGNVERLHAALPIAMVGSRAMSGYGEMMAERLVSDLVDQDPTIVSGFMTGVDMTAHRTAVALGVMTVGVMGCGFDFQVPVEQEDFRAEMIAAGNLLISEYPPTAPPRPYQFVARNRIIAGLALAAIVVEAAQESGSLHTAQFALEYGRVVCAVPGAVTNPLSEGTRQLLRSGSAVAVGSGTEILSELPLYAVAAASEASGQVSHAALFEQRVAQLTDELEQRIARAVAAEPLTIDDIFKLINQPISSIMAAVTSLEFQGVVRKDGDKLLANLCTMGRSFVSSANQQSAQIEES